jgi:hypothetical protein
VPQRPFWGHYGFDPERLLRSALPQFELVHFGSYNHIREARGRMGLVWRLVDSWLAHRHPRAGATLLIGARRSTT